MDFNLYKPSQMVVTGAAAGSVFSSAHPTFKSDSLVVRVNVDSVTGNEAFTSAEVSTVLDTIQVATPNNLRLGTKVQLTTSGVLPTGLAVLTDYFAIPDPDNPALMRLASSLANALANIFIDITGAGSGSSSINPVALTNATVFLEASSDRVNWDKEPSGKFSSAITADAVLLWELDYIRYPYYRVSAALDAGTLLVDTAYSGKNGD